jgi:hypothetical protein
MKATKKRIEKIEAAIAEQESAGKPRFRAFFKDEVIPPPEKGVLHIVFNMPAPQPVPEELLPEN